MSEPTLTGRFPVKFGKIDTAASGDTTLLAADTENHIRIIGFFLVASGSVAVKFKSGATDLTGGMALAANGGVTAESQNGVMTVNKGEAFVINLGSAIQVSGAFSYIKLP